MVNSDGTGLTTVAKDSSISINLGNISRSPDGSKIAFHYLPTHRDPGNHDLHIAIASAGSSALTEVDSKAAEALPSWSPDSRKLAITSQRDGNFEIYVMNTDGTGQTNITNNEAVDGLPSWSPDGSKIAFISKRGDGKFAIYVMDNNGSGVTKLTDAANIETRDGLLWSPDGDKIAFVVRDSINMGIWVMNADGTGLAEIITLPRSGHLLCPAWSPGGSKIAFSATIEPSGYGQTDIYVMDTDGTNTTKLTDSTGYDDQPTWSMYGSKIAFISDRDGNSEIYVMNANGSDQTNISNSPGDEHYPVWSPQ